MKSALNKFTLALEIILIGTLLSGKAFAACGDSAKSRPGASLLPQSWDGQSGALLPISASSSDDRIVGMWNVIFNAERNELGPRDATAIDTSPVCFHRP